MKSIPLTQDKFALVDDEDFDYLNQFSWSLDKGKRTFYARGYVDGRLQRMHRLMLNAKTNELVDHKDRNGLNNTRENIRLCTSSQNSMNRVSQGLSKYVGVGIERRKFRTDRWVAYININGKKKRIGRFRTEIEAAIARNKAAYEYYGEFANLNIIT